jgi:hypothetical protein
LIASAGFSEAAIPAAIYTIDAQGKITFFNQAARHQLWRTEQVADLYHEACVRHGKTPGRLTCSYFTHFADTTEQQEIQRSRPIRCYKECAIPALPGDPETTPPSYRHFIDMVDRLRNMKPTFPARQAALCRKGGGILKGPRKVVPPPACGTAGPMTLSSAIGMPLTLSSDFARARRLRSSTRLEPSPVNSRRHPGIARAARSGHLSRLACGYTLQEAAAASKYRQRFS